MLTNPLSGGMPAAAAAPINIRTPVVRMRRQSPPISAMLSVRSSRTMMPAPRNRRAFDQPWVNAWKTLALKAPAPNARTASPISLMVA